MANGKDKTAFDVALLEGETVSVRMYCGILGDFFVLTHIIEPKDSGRSVYRALIDCGALQCIGNREIKKATAASLDRLEICIASLLKEEPHFDLVIATHEHYDHLSGFVKHNGLFEEAGFSIGELWLAWTENDADNLAVSIREGRSKGLEAINALVADDATARSFGLKLTDETVRSQIEGLRNLMQFNGELDPVEAKEFANRLVKAKPSDGPPPKKPRSCRDALNWLKQKAKEPNVRYLDPGEQISFGLDKRLQASVLGPPRTKDRLLKMDPDKKSSEVYLTDRDDYLALLTNMSTRHQLSRKRSEQAVDSAANELPDDVEIFEPVDTDSPFNDYGPVPEVKMVTGKNGKLRAESDWRVAELYYDPENATRRIDGDWLGVAQTLALKIDGDVNNTSLALAIEVPGRHVLLFPADAQVGNWLSWHDQTYPSKRGAKSEGGESATDILSRVVLYKVGHHGSHNATAKELGLELMTSPHLAAMIPVVEDVAAEQTNRSNPDGWAMPYDNLYARLKSKTSLRIVRGDDRLLVQDGNEAEMAELAKRQADLDAAFKTSIFDLNYDKDNPADPLWVSLTLGRTD
jgi:hypothetical protein